MIQRDTQTQILLEVCVDNLTSAQAALGAGADRLELCSALSEGGLTPTPGFVQTLRDTTTADLVCMLRPRGGSFTIHREELGQLMVDLNALRKAGANGFVFGALLPSGELDLPSLECVIQAAAPLPVTFHRAFDQLKNPKAALQELMRVGCRRLLSSGMAETAYRGRHTLHEWMESVGDGLELIAAGSVRHGNLEPLLRISGLHAVHVGASVTHDAGAYGADRMCDAEEVGLCRRILDDFGTRG